MSCNPALLQAGRAACDALSAGQNRFAVTLSESALSTVNVTVDRPVSSGCSARISQSDNLLALVILLPTHDTQAEQVYGAAIEQTYELNSFHRDPVSPFTFPPVRPFSAIIRPSLQTPIDEMLGTLGALAFSYAFFTAGPTATARSAPRPART